MVKIKHCKAMHFPLQFGGDIGVVEFCAYENTQSTKNTRSLKAPNPDFQKHSSQPPPPPPAWLPMPQNSANPHY